MERIFSYGNIIIAISNFLDCIILANVMNVFLSKRRLHQNVIRTAFGVFWLFTTGTLCACSVTWHYFTFYLFLLFLLTFFYEEFWIKRIWVVFTLGSIQFSCLLIAYFAASKEYTFVQVCISTLLFLLCFGIVKRLGFVQREEEEINRSWLFLLLLVSVASVVALYALLGEMKVSNTFGIISCVCVLIIDLSAFILYHALLQNDEYAAQRDTYKQLLYYNKNQMEVIAESQNKMRALRHDMKNHLIHLSTQLKSEKYEDALQYLQAMMEDIQADRESVSTGNAEVDSLLNYKIQIAKKVLRKVEYRIRIPADYEWKSLDFNIIVGNLLDNALEAANKSKEKFLEMDIHTDKGVLLIHIANSYRNEPMKQGERFLSTKKKPEAHGIGLQNVRRIVEKQNGDMELRFENGLFEADVMLYLKLL